MTAVSPGMVAVALNNQHYSSDEDYLRALGRRCRLSVEYHAIVARGLLLQIDAPDLAVDRSGPFSELSLAEYMRWAEMVVDTINNALEGIEPQRVRLHVCWGNMEAPHTHDVALEDILGTLYRAHVGALVISMANPRHAHEYKCFARHPLPDGMKLVAGVIDSTTNYVEHPEVVADRLERVATAVGDPTRIMAGTDCGFASLAGYTPVAPSIV
jgi:5-methyltetrahydropteroyltriglutamate--homocysteine methyltransferase